MNLYELQALIKSLENENNINNIDLISFYKKKEIELVNQINTRIAFRLRNYSPAKNK